MAHNQHQHSSERQRQVHDEYTMHGGSIEVWATPDSMLYSIELEDDTTGQNAAIILTAHQFRKLARAMAVETVSVAV